MSQYLMDQAETKLWRNLDKLVESLKKFPTPKKSFRPGEHLYTAPDVNLGSKASTMRMAPTPASAKASSSSSAAPPPPPHLPIDKSKSLVNIQAPAARDKVCTCPSIPRGPQLKVFLPLDQFLSMSDKQLRGEGKTTPWGKNVLRKKSYQRLASPQGMKVTTRTLGVNGSASRPTSMRHCVCGARGDVTLEPHSEDEWEEEDLVYEDEDLPSDAAKEQLKPGMSDNIAEPKESGLKQSTPNSHLVLPVRSSSLRNPANQRRVPISRVMSARAQTPKAQTPKDAKPSPRSSSRFSYHGNHTPPEMLGGPVPVEEDNSLLVEPPEVAKTEDNAGDINISSIVISLPHAQPRPGYVGALASSSSIPGYVKTCTASDGSVDEKRATASNVASQGKGAPSLSKPLPALPDSTPPRSSKPLPALPEANDSQRQGKMRTKEERLLLLDARWPTSRSDGPWIPPLAKAQYPEVPLRKSSLHPSPAAATRFPIRVPAQAENVAPGSHQTKGSPSAAVQNSPPATSKFVKPQPALLPSTTLFSHSTPRLGSVENIAPSGPSQSRPRRDGHANGSGRSEQLSSHTAGSTPEFFPRKSTTTSPIVTAKDVHGEISPAPSTPFTGNQTFYYDDSPQNSIIKSVPLHDPFAMNGTPTKPGAKSTFSLPKPSGHNYDDPPHVTPSVALRKTRASLFNGTDPMYHGKMGDSPKLPTVPTYPGRAPTSVEAQSMLLNSAMSYLSDQHAIKQRHHEM
ncbi:hypothetical protein DFH27DRAFT_599474 [Peziza echinospora]|nr:hypothetical protein DFH27DRAFT_599474 [Peziza echinospora]